MSEGSQSVLQCLNHQAWLEFKHYLLETKWSQLLETIKSNCYLNVLTPFSLPKSTFNSCTKYVFHFIDLSVQWFFKWTVYANQERHLCSSWLEDLLHKKCLNSLDWAYVCSVSHVNSLLFLALVFKAFKHSILVMHGRKKRMVLEILCMLIQ